MKTLILILSLTTITNLYSQSNTYCLAQLQQEISYGSVAYYQIACSNGTSFKTERTITMALIPFPGRYWKARAKAKLIKAMSDIDLIEVGSVEQYNKAEKTWVDYKEAPVLIFSNNTSDKEYLTARIVKNRPTGINQDYIDFNFSIANNSIGVSKVFWNVRKDQIANYVEDLGFNFLFEVSSTNFTGTKNLSFQLYGR